MKPILDLTLIGSVVIDDVYIVEDISLGISSLGSSNAYVKHYKSLGGIGNLLTVLKDFSLEIDVRYLAGVNDSRALPINKYGFLGKDNKLKILNKVLIPTEKTAKALILSDNKKLDKVSFVNWSNTEEITSVGSNAVNKTYWGHISYLDLLPKLNLNRIRSKSKILSADLCLNNSSEENIGKILNNFKELDFLFISDNEIKNYKTIHPQCKTYKDICNHLFTEYNIKQWIIYHEKEFITAIDGTGKNTITIQTPKIIKDISVLGAGDKFCASFIANLLSNKREGTYDSEDVTRAVIFAQQNTANHINSFIEINDTYEH